MLSSNNNREKITRRFLKDLGFEFFLREPSLQKFYHKFPPWLFALW